MQETCNQGIVIYLIKKGEFRLVWEMQDVEDFNQTNEGKMKKEGKRHLHIVTQHSDKTVCLAVSERD